MITKRAHQSYADRYSLLPDPDGRRRSGIINAPTDQSISSVTVVPDPGDTATVASVIEIGAGNTPLTFNQPVQILFPGQAGKHVGLLPEQRLYRDKPDESRQCGRLGAEPKWIL